MTLSVPLRHRNVSATCSSLTLEPCFYHLTRAAQTTRIRDQLQTRLQAHLVPARCTLDLRVSQNNVHGPPEPIQDLKPGWSGGAGLTLSVPSSQPSHREREQGLGAVIPGLRRLAVQASR